MQQLLAVQRQQFGDAQQETADRLWQQIDVLHRQAADQQQQMRAMQEQNSASQKLAVRKAGIPDNVTHNSSTDCRGTGCGRDCDHSDVGLIGRRVLSGNTAYPGPVAAISASEENTFTFGGSATAVGGNGLSHLPTATMAKQRCTHDRRVRERETIRPEIRGSFGEDFVSGSSCFPLCPRGSPFTAWSHWPMTGLSEHHTMSC